MRDGLGGECRGLWEDVMHELCLEERCSSQKYPWRVGVNGRGLCSWPREQRVKCTEVMEKGFHLGNDE